MIACVDVDYRETEAVAACLLFYAWGDETSCGRRVEHVTPVEPYQPGQFYRRELPCLLRVLTPLLSRVETVVIDGYVWLQDETTPGLGGHLWAALNRGLPVLGVAKTRYAGAGAARPILRGDSKVPLYVTAAGMPLDEACRCVERMHGPYRIPTLLKAVDHLCRHA